MPLPFPVIRRRRMPLREQMQLKATGNLDPDTRDRVRAKPTKPRHLPPKVAEAYGQPKNPAEAEPKKVEVTAQNQLTDDGMPVLALPAPSKPSEGQGQTSGAEASQGSRGRASKGRSKTKTQARGRATTRRK